MAKTVKIRASYRDDAAFLLRLETAVRKDHRQTEEWRNETADQIRKLSVRLLTAKMEEQSSGQVVKTDTEPRPRKAAAAR